MVIADAGVRWIGGEQHNGQLGIRSLGAAHQLLAVIHRGHCYECIYIGKFLQDQNALIAAVCGEKSGDERQVTRCSTTRNVGRAMSCRMLGTGEAEKQLSAFRNSNIFHHGDTETRREQGLRTDPGDRQVFTITTVIFFSVPPCLRGEGCSKP